MLGTPIVGRRQREMVHTIAKGQAEKGRFLALKHLRKFNEQAEENQKRIEG
jgi:hypothetical protein